MAGHQNSKVSSQPAIKLEHPPKHVAIICDGNRRWARRHGLQVLLGHRRAIEDTLEPLIQRASDDGVEYLTFWVFSTENWKRSKEEVEGLFGLFREFFAKQINRVIAKGARVKAIGDISKLPKDIQQSIIQAEKDSENNQGITVIFAINYGGRDELKRAVDRLAKDVQAGKVDASNGFICEELISKYLDTAEFPDPDLIIRTSGEHRLSGFMLWQSKYSELAFPDFAFPEFTPEKLDEILLDFSHRDRRFGGK